MRRCVCCLLLLLGLVSPTALALDEESAAQATQAQSEAFGFDDLERIGEAYTGQEDIAGGVDVPGAFRHVGQTAKDNLGQVVKTAVRSCVLLLAVTLLWGLAQGMQAGAGESGGLEAITLAAVLAITAVAVGDVHSLLSLGEEAIYNMETLGDVLLPAVSMATAASGSPAMAVVKHGATILFSDFLLRLIHSLLIPLCYAFVAANVAWAALANEGLKRLAGFLKWLITMVLSVVLLVFVGYLNLSGVISGGADAATVKAAKFTLSNLVPVVGGVISDTAETLGDVLLPAVSMATAASGSPAMAVVKHGATILFSDFLLRLIHSLLIPLCYAFVAANVAWAALANEGLKRLAGFLKWLITMVLSVVLLVFVGYLNLSGVISGGADAATVKAAKFTLSNLVPVVGGVISDTAETLLAGAAILRNAAGVFGMLAVLGICVAPFLNLGAHYLLYKGTAALAATAAGSGRLTGLIEALGTAFGLILAMTASCAVLLTVAMVSAVSAVG